MKTYIERAAVEKFIEDGLNNPDKNKAFGHDAIEIMAEIHYMPAADIAEVRHGRWLKRSDGTPYCSNCGANERDTYSSVVNECAFCYSCGARMGKEDEHEAD